MDDRPVTRRYKGVGDAGMWFLPDRPKLCIARKDVKVVEADSPLEGRPVAPALSGCSSRAQPQQADQEGPGEVPEEAAMSTTVEHQLQGLGGAQTEPKS